MDLLSKNSVGVDISDYTVEVVEAKRQNKKNKIVSLGRAILEPGTVKNGIITDREKLKVAVAKAFSKAQPKAIDTKKIVFVLPESQVYSYILSLEVNNEKKINKIIEKKITENIPVKKENIVYSYKIISKEEKERDKDENPTLKVAKSTLLFKILIIAVDNEIVQEWRDFFKADLRMDIDIFDTEPQAIYRSLSCENDPEPQCCFVDIGADQTNISIFQGFDLYYSYTFAAGGNFLTKNISEIKATADGEKIGLAKAELLKTENGLSDIGEFSKEVNLILKNGLRTIAEEIKIALQFVNETYNLKITEIILLGGTAKLKGIEEYFFDYLKDVSIEQKDNLALAQGKVSEDKDKNLKNFVIKIGESSIDQGKSPIEYIEALGAAVRGIDSRFKNDLEIKPPNVKKKKETSEKKEPENEEDIVNYDENEEVVEKVSWVKSHPKELQLIVILAIGILLIPLAFWYRSYDAKKRIEAQRLADAKYEETVIYDYKIPISVDASAYSGTSIRGRVVEATVEQSTSYEKALELAKNEVLGSKKETETLWGNPINETDDKENLIFPLDFEFMFYSEKNANDLFLKKAKQDSENKFLLDKIDLLKVSKDEEGDYYLEGSISVLTAGGKSKDLVNDDAEISKNENEITDNNKSVEDDLSLSNETKNDDEKIENDTNIDINNSDENEESEDITSETEEKTDEMTLEELMKSLKRAKEVEILETGIGYLNVRAGASVSEQLVTKVFPGERYEKIDETDSWVKIKISDEQVGWVSSKYVEN